MQVAIAQTDEERGDHQLTRLQLQKATEAVAHMKAEIDEASEDRYQLRVRIFPPFIPSG